VAWRIAIDRRPRSPFTIVPGFDPESDSAPADAPSTDPGPEQDLIHANQQAQIHSMIDALPEDLRIPLVFSAFEELNSREIGRILGVPEGTVRTRLQRGRQFLRQKLTALEKAPFHEPCAQEVPYG
jgi:RNA polymerase sigma-70 factor (ECF subfamily)